MKTYLEIWYPVIQINKKFIEVDIPDEEDLEPWLDEHQLDILEENGFSAEVFDQSIEEMLDTKLMGVDFATLN